MTHVTSGRDEPLDLGNGMRRQFLRDFGGDALGDFRMEGLAQVSQYFRRRDDNEPVEKIGVRAAIEHVGKFAGKPLLRYVVPVGLVHGTSSNANAGIGSSRTVGALLSCRRIVAFQNLFDDK